MLGCFCDLLSFICQYDIIYPAAAFQHNEAYNAFKNFRALAYGVKRDDGYIRKSAERESNRHAYYPYKAAVKQQCGKRFSA